MPPLPVDVKKAGHHRADGMPFDVSRRAIDEPRAGTKVDIFSFLSFWGGCDPIGESHPVYLVDGLNFNR